MTLGNAPATIAAQQVTIVEIRHQVWDRAAHWRRAVEGKSHAYTFAARMAGIFNVDHQSAVEVARCAHPGTARIEQRQDGSAAARFTAAVRVAGVGRKQLRQLLDLVVIEVAREGSVQILDRQPDLQALLKIHDLRPAGHVQAGYNGASPALPGVPMTSMLVGVSHSPIIMIRARAPADEPAILGLYAQCTQAIAAFAPECVVIFGSDHFAGFFYSNMPAYCLGLAATAVDDVGGFAGPLNVPAATATELLQRLRRDGFDPSLSQQMKVDHAFSQPLRRLTGALDRYPTIPLFIGALAPPFIGFARSRALGESVGRHFAASGQRVLYIGSGGLSHHPTRYYPLPGEATPSVAAWQLAGPQGGDLSEQQWLRKLYDEHVAGADMLISGQSTDRRPTLRAHRDHPPRSAP